MNPRLVIVGFMGCGKTTVARALASRLYCQMIDLDSLITEREQRSPAEIIQRDGEKTFREIESQYLRQALTGTQSVIAVGGGTWTIEENRKLIDRNARSIWLDVAFETCWQRITASKVTRPLAPNRNSAYRLYQSRRPLYALASLHLTADQLDVESIVERILAQS